MTLLTKINLATNGMVAEGGGSTFRIFSSCSTHRLILFFGGLLPLSVNIVSKAFYVNAQCGLLTVCPKSYDRNVNFAVETFSLRFLNC